MAHRSYLDVICTCLTALRRHEAVTVGLVMAQYELLDARAVRNALAKLVEHGHATRETGGGNRADRYVWASLPGRQRQRAPKAATP